MKGLAITKSTLDIRKNKDLLHARLERLFFCELNSSIGMLQRGSRIPEIIDSFSSEEIPKFIVAEVNFLINTYETEIELQSVTVVLTDTETGISEVEITIEFIWNDTDIQDSLTLKK